MPLNASTGPTLVVVQTERGEISLEGPEFTVTDELLPPKIDSFSPKIIGLGNPRGVLGTVQGSAFSPGITRLAIDGSEYPIDWSRSHWSMLVFSIPQAVADVPGTHVVRLHTPKGGDSEPVEFEVAPAINLVGAEARNETMVVIRFDQEVDLKIARQETSYTIVERPDGILKALVQYPEHKEVLLLLKQPMPPGETWTIRVIDGFVSVHGSPIGNREATFATFTPSP